MQVNIELPEDVSRALRERWGDVSRRTLEAIALEGYRSGALTESQVRRLLGFETRMEVHAFLKQAGIPLHYSKADLDEDLEAHRKLGVLRNYLDLHAISGSDRRQPARSWVQNSAGR